MSIFVLLQLSELTDEQKEYMAKLESEKAEASTNTSDSKGPTSIFHGKSEKDYQGVEVLRCGMWWQE
jgi:hypothetical protein